MNEVLIAGLVAIAIGLVEVIKIAAKKFGQNKSVLTEIERLQLRELHEWHAKEDSDGVKIWYIRQSLSDAITSFNITVAAQTRVLEAIVDRLSDMDHKLESLKKD